MADDTRRFDEKEVGLILKRVAELHTQQGDAASSRSLTRAEIEEVVTELGISKSLVARAASEISVRDVRNRPVWWLGGKTDVLLEATIDSTIDEATLDRMLEVLRRYFADAGDLTRQGNARIWTATRRTSRRIQFTAFEADGKTTVRLEERMPVDARTTVGGGVTAGFGGSILVLMPLKAVLIKAVLLMALPGVMASGAVAGWLVGRGLWKRRAVKREQELHAAFGELLALAPSVDK